jgi:hypothetical protein
MFYSFSYKGHMVHGKILNNVEPIEVQLFNKVEHWFTFKYRQVKSIRAAKCLITRYVNSKNA